MPTMTLEQTSSTTTKHGPDVRRAAASILSALRGKEFRLNVGAMLDLFEECGEREPIRVMGHYRRCPDGYKFKRGTQESFERFAALCGLVTWDDCPCHREAVELQSRLETIDVAAVKVVSAERRPGRVELAKMARKLMTALGLRGVSITAPSYSMAQSVDVSMVYRQDFTTTDRDDHWARQDDPARAANAAARKRMQSLLLAAFPGTDDRSDSMTDYFDYCWSID